MDLWLIVLSIAIYLFVGIFLQYTGGVNFTVESTFISFKDILSYIGSVNFFTKSALYPLRRYFLIKVFLVKF